MWMGRPRTARRRQKGRCARRDAAARQACEIARNRNSAQVGSKKHDPHTRATRRIEPGEAQLKRDLGAIELQLGRNGRAIEA